MVNFDVVIPDKNEEEFIEQAKALGYKEIVFLTNNVNYVKPKDSSIIIKTAYIIKDSSEIDRVRRKFDYLFAKAERKYFESKIDFIIDVELSCRKDSFHYKSTGLNQVHADLAKKNNMTVVFDFGALILNPVVTKGKMVQNALLVKKYKLKYAVFSLATQPNMMRSINILHSLETVLGL
jgi:RNase P/RNase MRP subunit p30